MLAWTTGASFTTSFGEPKSLTIGFIATDAAFSSLNYGDTY